MLWTGISLRLSQYFECIELFFYSDVSLSPCCWKTAPQHEAATSTLYFWDGTLQVMNSSWFPSNMMFGIEVHQTRESRFSESEGPLGAFFANSRCVFMCLHWGEDCIWPHQHKAQIGGVLQWCLSFCRFPIRFLVTTLTKALLHQLLSLARRPGRVKLLPLRLTETTCFCETSMQHNFFFLNSSPDVWFTAILSQRYTEGKSWPNG